MIKNASSRLIFCCLLCVLPYCAAAGENEKMKVPLKLEPTKTSYADLNGDLPLWPEEDILSGISEHRYESLYSGDIQVMIYQAKPMTLRITDYSIDEFVTVISGTLILTAKGGSPQRFDAGESVLVPKGFTGTWEMQGDFREMVVYLNETNQQ